MQKTIASFFSVKSCTQADSTVVRYSGASVAHELPHIYEENTLEGAVEWVSNLLAVKLPPLAVENAYFYTGYAHCKNLMLFYIYLL